MQSNSKIVCTSRTYSTMLVKHKWLISKWRWIEIPTRKWSNLSMIVLCYERAVHNTRPHLLTVRFQHPTNQHKHFCNPPPNNWIALAMNGENWPLITECIWIGWGWDITSWSLRLQENYWFWMMMSTNLPRNCTMAPDKWIRKQVPATQQLTMNGENWPLVT